MLCGRNIRTEPPPVLPTRTPAGRLVTSAGGMTATELLGVNGVIGGDIVIAVYQHGEFLEFSDDKW